MSGEHEGPSDGGGTAGGSTAGVPWQVRSAGWVVGLEALAALAFTAALIVRGASTDTTLGLVLGQAGLFAVVGAALLAVARGLVVGGRWARTPAIVTQLLLLPVAYSLIGPSRQLVAGVVTGLLVGGCFLLLISAAAREWAESG
ncbi:MAG: hypothetical protein ACT4RN_12330 [Pseudonocardia sp.]